MGAEDVGAGCEPRVWCYIIPGVFVWPRVVLTDGRGEPGQGAASL